MKSRINDVEKVLGGMKTVFSCTVMGLNVNRLYKGVAVPTTIYGGEIWSIAVGEKRLNVMEVKCLRSMCRVLHMDKVGLENTCQESRAEPAHTYISNLVLENLKIQKPWLNNDSLPVYMRLETDAVLVSFLGLVIFGEAHHLL